MYYRPPPEKSATALPERGQCFSTRRQLPERGQNGGTGSVLFLAFGMIDSWD